MLIWLVLLIQLSDMSFACRPLGPRTMPILTRFKLPSSFHSLLSIYKIVAGKNKKIVNYVLLYLSFQFCCLSFFKQVQAYFIFQLSKLAYKYLASYFKTMVISFITCAQYVVTEALTSFCLAYNRCCRILWQNYIISYCHLP